jgi:hypothetical protein
MIKDEVGVRSEDIVLARRERSDELAVRYRMRCGRGDIVKKADLTIDDDKLESSSLNLYTNQPLGFEEESRVF